MQTKIRIAPSLGGGFAGTPQDTWGLGTYNPETDKDNPCVFMGVYGLPDFYELWKHRGKKWIFWCGSDIRHFKNGYWLDDKGKVRIEPKGMAEWVNKQAESWVENELEKLTLASLGIKAKVCPSFLGKVDEYQISYQHSYNPKLYTSVSGDDFFLYGWYKIDALAKKNPCIEFHLYGNHEPWKIKRKNVFVHGRVSQETMDKEIKEMQGALRLTTFDGFSEILAKSILLGQHPVSIIDYPHILPLSRIDELLYKRSPNTKGRNYYKKKLNKFPWVKHVTS